MAYVPNYTTDDLPVMAIDLAGHVLFTFMAFIVIIVLIGVATYLKVRGKKLSKW